MGEGAAMKKLYGSGAMRPKELANDVDLEALEKAEQFRARLELDMRGEFLRRVKNGAVGYIDPVLRCHLGLTAEK
jgi:hypothetical protein